MNDMKHVLLITPLLLYMVSHILYSILLLIFMYKVTSKIRFDVSLGGGVGLRKTLQLRCLFQKP